MTVYWTQEQALILCVTVLLMTKPTHFFSRNIYMTRILFLFPKLKSELKETLSCIMNKCEVSTHIRGLQKLTKSTCFLQTVF